MSETSVLVKASLSYSVPPPDGIRAYQKVNVDPQTGIGSLEQNIETELKDMQVENVRGREGSVSLDTTGFQYFPHTSEHKSFATNEEIISEYYPESIELIKKLTGASRVSIFDHTVRGRRLAGKAQLNKPLAQVHVDQSTKAAIARVHKQLPDEAPKLLESRFQILNLWRPIGHPAFDWPLALCDYRSVIPEKDTFSVSLVFPGHEGETMGVKYNEGHKWKYLRGMTPEEVVFIKCFDSVHDGSVAVFAPHTGFEDPTTPEGSPLRESIELRALVFY